MTLSSDNVLLSTIRVCGETSEHKATKADWWRAIAPPVKPFSYRRTSLLYTGSVTGLGLFVYDTAESYESQHTHPEKGVGEGHTVITPMVEV